MGDCGSSFLLPKETWEDRPVSSGMQQSSWHYNSGNYCCRGQLPGPCQEKVQHTKIIAHAVLPFHLKSVGPKKGSYTLYIDCSPTVDPTLMKPFLWGFRGIHFPSLLQPSSIQQQRIVRCVGVVYGEEGKKGRKLFHPLLLWLTGVLHWLHVPYSLRFDTSKVHLSLNHLFRCTSKASKLCLDLWLSTIQYVF